jgi:DNA-binding transcriptional LysR family regulator
MNLQIYDGIPSFLAIVEFGTFSRAAEELDISRVTINMQITYLEEALGYPLFVRGANKHHLTAEGLEFLSHAKKLQRELEELEAISIKNSNAISGIISLGIPSVLMNESLLIHLNDFTIAFPNIKLNINCTDESMNLVEESLDAVIRIDGETDTPNLNNVELFQIERKLVAHPSLIKENIRTPKDLDKLSWIGLKMLPNYRPIEHKVEGIYKIQFKPRIVVNNVSLATQLAKLGAGVYTPPTFMIKKELQTGELVHLLPEWNIPTLSVHFFMHSNSSQSSHIARLRDFLLERYSKVRGAPTPPSSK